MLLILFYTCVLVVSTVVIHAAGLSMLLRAVMKSSVLTKVGFWSATWLVIALTCWLLLIHLAEIVIWGLFYLWQGWLPDAESAFYFSGVTYTSVGYGDVVLPKPWGIVAAIETLTGILMCGLSTGLFLVVTLRRLNYWMNVKHGKNLADRP
jgi:hypothetical protein